MTQIMKEGWHSGRVKKGTRSGYKKKPEVLVEDGQGICIDDTPKSLHGGATSVKSSITCKKKCPRTLQICPKMGKTLHNQESPWE